MPSVGVVLVVAPFGQRESRGLLRLVRGIVWRPPKVEESHGCAGEAVWHVVELELPFAQPSHVCSVFVRDGRGTRSQIVCYLSVTIVITGHRGVSLKPGDVGLAARQAEHSRQQTSNAREQSTSAW